MSPKDNLLNETREKALKLIEEWIQTEEKKEIDSNDEKPEIDTILTGNHVNNEMKEKKNNDPTSN